MEIRLKQITFGYEPEFPIIQNMACSFFSGRFYSVIGPNGSGKTTLLDLISGFLPVRQGQISLDGKNIIRISKKSLSTLISTVSQDYAINFPFLVKDVVMMGRHPYISRFSHPSKADIKVVETMIDQCGISHLKDRKINTLSGGERQRCVFARALCQETPILLLDEAFSSMDIRHTLDMLHMVKSLVKEENKLVISVFHDLNLASAWSDELLLLKSGKIHAFGSGRDVLTRESIKSVFNVESVVTFNASVQARQVSYPTV
jgi:iron complex transport system ATP-binding protein